MVFAEPIIHVDMDSFFVECERLRNSDLRGIPVAVGGGGPRGVIAAASYEARAFGVHSAQATARARRFCPQLVLVPPDHGWYGRISESVFAIMRSITPMVEGLSVDEAFLDVGGLSRHHATSVEIADLVRRRVRTEVGIPSSAGVAATKFMAKLASQRAKPDGLLRIALGEQLAFLHALPVRALWGVGEATHASLERLGIATVGDLAAIEPRVLARQLGPSAGAHLSAIARGEDARPVVPHSEAKSVSVEETYATDLHDPAVIRIELLKHATALAGRARRAGVTGRTVTLKVRYTDFDTPTRSVTLPSSTDVGRDIHQAAVRLLERMPRRGVGVRLLGIGLSHLESVDAPRQLLTDRAPKWDELEDAVHGVRERFGQSAVRPAALIEGTRASADESGDSFGDENGRNS